MEGVFRAVSGDARDRVRINSRHWNAGIVPILSPSDMTFGKPLEWSMLLTEFLIKEMLGNIDRIQSTDTRLLFGVRHCEPIPKLPTSIPPRSPFSAEPSNSFVSRGFNPTGRNKLATFTGTTVGMPSYHITWSPVVSRRQSGTMEVAFVSGSPQPVESRLRWSRSRRSLCALTRFISSSSALICSSCRSFFDWAGRSCATCPALSRPRVWGCQALITSCSRTDRFAPSARVQCSTSICIRARRR